MTDFRAKRAPSIPGRAIHPVANVRAASTTTGAEKRRGVRVNSRVPVAVEWHAGGELIGKGSANACRRTVWLHGGTADDLEVKQSIRLTNMVSKVSSPAVIVWRRMERAKGRGTGN